LSVEVLAMIASLYRFDSSAYDLVMYMMKDRGKALMIRIAYAKLNGSFSCIEVGPDVVDNPFVRELVESEVERVNGQLANYETIKRYTIMPRKFTENRNELTPTLKIKSQVIYENCQAEINALYQLYCH
jgi:long-subunit acyl-CoA synthetase (AMP-forming)